MDPVPAKPVRPRATGPLVRVLAENQAAPHDVRLVARAPPAIAVPLDFHRAGLGPPGSR